MSSLPTSPAARIPKKRKRTLEQQPQREPTARELIEYQQHREMLASLGDGGRMTWDSSPHVMWLAWRLARGAR